MSEPKRVQRKRTKGWKMPLNTVYVGRPSKWGNPYPMMSKVNRFAIILAYEEWLRKKLVGNPAFLDELKGKDLACWCSLDKSCHADVLLTILREMS